MFLIRVKEINDSWILNLELLHERLMLGDNLTYFTCLFYLIFSSYNNLILGILLVLFTFIGNNLNWANAEKMSEDGQEEQKKARKDDREGRATMPEIWHGAAVPSSMAMPPQHEVVVLAGTVVHLFPARSVARFFI